MTDEDLKQIRRIVREELAALEARVLETFNAEFDKADPAEELRAMLLEKLEGRKE